MGATKALLRTRRPLSKAVEHKELSQALVAKGVVPHWAGSFSWTEVLHNPHGIFFPYIEKVLQRLLVKGARGLSFIFVEYDQFMQGKSGYSHFNTILAWNPEQPDISSNLLGRTAKEKKQLIIKELRMFLDQISQLKTEYVENKTELIPAPIELNFEALECSHKDISYHPREPYAKLLLKSEQARNEMRRYQEEIAVLTTLKLALSRLKGEAGEAQLDNPIEEQVAWFTLSLQPKYLVKERRTRQILQILGLPENRVRTRGRPSSKTDYELIDVRFR